MKLNLGCGFQKQHGWLNVDKALECAPDQLVDLELTPWPWPDSCATTVNLHHVLEHLGETSRSYLEIIRELWRVTQLDAVISVISPHPRCDYFLWDPTHVRPITMGGLRMFSQRRNREMIVAGNPETPLGIYLGVDFEILSTKYEWCTPWRQRLRSGQISADDLDTLADTSINVAKEIHVVLKTIKPAGSNSSLR